MNFLVKIYNKLRCIFYLLASDSICKEVNYSIVRQPVLLRGAGILKIGNGVKFGNDKSPGYLSNYIYIECRYSGSIITVGKNTVFNNNVSIICCVSIEIGENCLIGEGVTFYDSDFHGLKPELRGAENAKSSKIVVENNVFIGSYSRILKGVVIGQNSVIGVGSVVTRNVPQNVVVAGNPAKIIKSL